ncbi:ArsR/SmtB family transcription factor [Methanocella sp. MCL-LM]|uniref:ArsR/SmtB family transcription factor n=1 Tax=Methanocella sp. MCL-LM TaxID=3412035 RepID=UPI003C745F96
MPEDDKMLIVPLGEESKIITQTIANDTARKILELLAETPMSTSNIAKRLDIPLTTAQYNIEKLMEAGLVVIEKTKYSEKGREVKLYAPAKRMIVLVPKTATSQSLIDALKKYFVLLPIALVASLFVEVAMQLQNGAGFLLGSKLQSDGVGEAGDPLLMATMNNTYNNAGTNAQVPVSAPMPPLPEATAMATDMAREPTVFFAAAGNTTSGFDKAAGATGDAVGRAGDSLTGLPAVPPADTGAAQSLIPFDLLNHWGLWFLTGCLLIIGVMVVYDLYIRRKVSKK